MRQGSLAATVETNRTPGVFQPIHAVMRSSRREEALNFSAITCAADGRPALAAAHAIRHWLATRQGAIVDRLFRASLRRLLQLSLLSYLFWLPASRCAAQTAVAITNAPTLPAPRLLVIPQPKSLHPGAGTFVWPRNSGWRLQAPVRDARLWAAAAEILGSPAGDFSTNQAWVSLQIGAPRADDFPAGPRPPAWAANPEGYRISVTSRGILIQAGTIQGVFYGLQTLGQLIETRGQNFSCPAVEITDWPSLKFRGAHWFPSASGAAMDRRLIENIFSTFKFNHCVIQCEAARWDSHPEIAMSNSISKADLRQLVELCRQQFLEPIPLINVPGHADWMFRHGQNSDLVEDPKAPYACCVSNPKTIQFIEDVMAECIDVFHPQLFHIGHDEITLRGRFPNPDSPFYHGQTATTLTIESANRLADWLAVRGIGTMMWGDMLLGPGEAADATSAKTVADARARRAGVSKKITIADWHYIWNADTRSLNALQADGFHTVAATWMEPVNIFRFSRAAIAAGSDGLLQTTWAGYFPDERALKADTMQFAAYVIAADYAWSGRTDPPAKLGYDAREIFLKAYETGPAAP